MAMPQLKRIILEDDKGNKHYIDAGSDFTIKIERKDDYCTGHGGKK
jgi:hypothetical protein